jgi:hypothetical protein
VASADIHPPLEDATLTATSVAELGVAVRPFRRLRVRVELPAEAAPVVLRSRQFAGSVEVASDDHEVPSGSSDLQVLTAARAEHLLFTSGRDHEPSPPAAAVVSIDDEGERDHVTGHLLLIGSMKSGTSTLYSHLRQHPAIAANRTAKEPGFFSSDAVYRGHYDYQSQYRFDASRHRWAMDGSTHYTKHPTFPGVPERIADLAAETRFLYVMRDPIERIESHVAHNIAKGRWTADDLDHPFERGLEVSRYSHQLDRFAATLEGFRDRLLLIDFADVAEELPATMRRIERFLDLDPHDYRWLNPVNVRRSTHGADRFTLDEEHVRWLWERLDDEPAQLRSRYGFVPRRPWGPASSR